VADGEQRSPWLYVAIGCGGILLVLVIAVGVLSYVGFRTVQTVKREMQDPVARAARAQRLLGADALPEGYFVGPALSIPLLFDLVILADQKPQPDGDLSRDTERLFIYVRLIRGGREWSEYAEGKGDPFEALEGPNLRLDRGERIAEGRTSVGDQQIAYVSERGEFRPDRGRAIDGILTLLFIDCPDDKRMRLGVWIGPDPAPDRPVHEVDFTGTAADPDRVRAFMSRFDTCAD
jgi:hypothetical protein